MIGLQRCLDCGTAQYPPRAFCGTCLADRLVSESAGSLPARVLALTRLHHSNEPGFQSRLPLICGLVRFDAGPVAVCFLTDTAEAGDLVSVRIGTDDLLEAG
jgi:uncharacterized OB-fold protein